MAVKEVLEDILGENEGNDKVVNQTRCCLAQVYLKLCCVMRCLFNGVFLGFVTIGPMQDLHIAGQKGGRER
jgi:hypothetical protein